MMKRILSLLAALTLLFSAALAEQAQEAPRLIEAPEKSGTNRNETAFSPYSLIKTRHRKAEIGKGSVGGLRGLQTTAPGYFIPWTHPGEPA